MALRFFNTNSEPLQLHAGIPSFYWGEKLSGAECYYINERFASIVVQELAFKNAVIRHVTIHWKKAERILCEADYLPSIFCRSMLHGTMLEVFKGLGDVFLKEDQFYSLIGSKWSSVLLSEKPGDHTILDVVIEMDALTRLMPECSNTGVHDVLPVKLTEVPHCISSYMRRAVENILDAHYPSFSDVSQINDLLLNYLKLVMREVNDRSCLKSRMSEGEWYYVEKTRELIETNLDKKFTTPEISVKIGLNEYKLKKVFRKVTGYAIDEYRKYKVLEIARRSIVKNQELPLKIISTEAGYYNLATFIRGFRLFFYCTPGELRSDSWDVSRIGDIPESCFNHD